MNEYVIQAALDKIDSALSEIFSQLKEQTKAIAEWPAKCAEHRMDIKDELRKELNGKSRNGQWSTLKIVALSLLGAGLVIGGTVAGIGYLVLKARGVL